jgi:hypothetical protein
MLPVVFGFLARTLDFFFSLRYILPEAVFMVDLGNVESKYRRLWNANKHKIRRSAIVPIHVQQKAHVAIVYMVTGVWENYRLAFSRMMWKKLMTAPLRIF